MLEAIDEAARELRAGAPAFSPRNLFFAVRRLGVGVPSFEEFRRGPLAQRLRGGPLHGLLPNTRAPRYPARLPREYDAYYPAAILLVDRREILDLLVACDVLPNARVAVVAVDGTPAHVVRWLARGARAGRRAPIGYLHDARTVVYPFLVEPLATFVDVCDSLLYRNLGIPHAGLLPRSFPFAEALPREERVTELEALPPCALLAYALRRLLAMVPGDPRMAALARPGARP